MDSKTWRNRQWLSEHYVAKGMSWPEIGRLVGRTANGVRLAAKEFGIPSRTIGDVVYKRIFDVAVIVKDYADGYSVNDLARKHNTVYSVMRCFMLRQGIKLRTARVGRAAFHLRGKKPLDEWANPEWLMNAYREYSTSEIAAAVGWSYTFVHGQLTKCGIPMRDASMAIVKKWTKEDFRTRCLNRAIGSALQDKLYALLTELGVPFLREGPATSILAGFRPVDCIIPANEFRRRSLIIEVNGYLHLRDNLSGRDRLKAARIKELLPDYDLEWIWDHELASVNVIEKLASITGWPLTVQWFEFVQVTVGLITYAETKSFLNLYHYLGKGRGGVCVGARLNGKLIGCVVISPLLRQNLNAKFADVGSELRELSRLCIHPIYQRKNFASWFIARALKFARCDAVVAYADVTAGHSGTVYRASNFKMHHQCPIDHWYVDSDGVMLHKLTLYRKAKAAKMTESGFRETFGYRKVFGDEKLCFVYALR